MSLENAFVLGAEGSALETDRACERLATVVMQLVATGKRVILFAGPTREREADARRQIARLPASADAWERAEILARASRESVDRVRWWLNQHGVQAAAIEEIDATPVSRGSPLEAEPRRISAPRIAAALEESPVVVIPGGVGQDGQGRAMSLGSGGTALSAVFAGDRFALPVRVLGATTPAGVDGLEDIVASGLPRRAALLARDARVSVFAAVDAGALLPPSERAEPARGRSYAVRASARLGGRLAIPA